MSQRTQMRLHAITGSLVDINTKVSEGVFAPTGSAAVAADNMLDVMANIAGAIKRIHGNADFLGEQRGVFTHDEVTVKNIADTQEITLNSGIVSASLDLVAGRDLDVERNADIKGDLVVSGALRVEDLTPTRLVFVGEGDTLVDSADLTFASGQLKVEGAVSGSGNFTVGGNLEVNGTTTLGGNLTIEAGQELIVADLVASHVVFVGASGELSGSEKMTHSDGTLTISGSTFSKSVAVAEDLSVARNLTVTGDLLVQGDTVTINVGEIVAEDKHIVLAKVDGNISDDTANDGGLILTGSTNHTILWRKNTPGNEAWEFSEHLVPAGTKDLGLTGDRWQNLWLTGNADVDGNADIQGTLTVGGLVDFNGHMSASLIKIDGDVADRLYIVDADGSIKDEADLTYSSGKLLVNGASGLEVTNAAVMKSTLDVDSTLNVAGTVSLDQSGLQLFQKLAGDLDFKVDAGDLFVSASAHVSMSAGGEMMFKDSYRDGSSWEGFGIKLASSQAEWNALHLAYGADISIIGALVSGGSGGKYMKEITGAGVAADSAIPAGEFVHVDGASDPFEDKWDQIVGATLAEKAAKVDVFVNGQLMVHGASADYLIDNSTGDITFKFALVADDLVVVKV